MMKQNKWTLRPLAVALLTMSSAGIGLASDWAGTYATADTKGHAFTITLSSDSAARGEKQGYELKGTWSADGSSAVIKWTTGWTTRLTRHQEGFKKSAYRPGTTLTDKASNEAPATKID